MVASTVLLETVINQGSTKASHKEQIKAHLADSNSSTHYDTGPEQDRLAASSFCLNSILVLPGASLW